MTIMKYATALFITAALGLASAQTPTTAAPATATQTVTATADPALATSAITIETGRYQGPLSSLLGAIAKSAGYELVLEVNVDNLAAEGTQARPVAYSFRDKPFNEVWPLLMDVYGLNYSISELGGQPVIRVNNTTVQRVVDLKAAEASYVVERARIFFGSPVAAQGQAATPTTGQATAAATQYQFDSPTLRVISDSVTNRVIIRGNNREVREVEAFVRNLDTSALAQRQQQEALYGTDTTATRREIYTANSDATQLLPFLQAQYPALRITSVPGGRSLVIDGNGSTVDEALALLRRVDPASGAATQKIFQLVNAQAEEVKEVLSQTLAREITGAAIDSARRTNSASSNTNTTNSQGQTINTTTSNNSNALGDAAKLAAQEATILADPRTNSLIVRGTPDQVAQIADLIPALDKRVPQINLQVRIQEISKDATNTLGVRWNASAGGFNVGVLPSGLTATFNPLQSVAGFNIFPVLNALESQRVSKRVYDGTVSMQSGQRNLALNTGSQDGSSTAAATIRSGGRLELNIVGPDQGENIEKTIPYGVVLDFFDPTVAPDGTISLRVRGQINQLNNRDALDAAIANGLPPQVLDFVNSDAQTKISFKSGETVLLAGLMGQNNSDTKAGLPFISRIPGLGALAGEQSQQDNTTQMLFVITGTVIE